MSPSVTRVQQEDPMGCGIAALAMILGRTYAEIRLGTGDLWRRGASWFSMEQLLADFGYAANRYWQWDQLKGHQEGEAWLNDRREPWPPTPFAPIHLCEVRTSQNHWVVMLEDGSVLDPACAGPKRLSDYSDVFQVMGIWKVRDSCI